MVEDVKDTVLEQEEETPNMEEKTFTQKDVDELISKRLNRERKKYANDEELTEFHEWKNSKEERESRTAQTIRERDELKERNDTLLKELNQIKNEKYLISKGVPVEDVDYFAFKIQKMVDEKTSFEQAAESYLKDKKVGGIRISTGIETKGNYLTNENERINDAFRQLRRM